MWGGLRWWFTRNREERDLDEEIRSHLAIEARERAWQGEPPESAKAAAQRAFGNVTRIREETRESWGWAEAERSLEDVRHGLRILKKAPSWTFVVGATLALGIGLSTAIFSVVYGVALKALPYPEPDRLMALWNGAPLGAYQRFNVNAPNWLNWRQRSRSFEDIALARLIANFNLTGDGVPERLQGARTSWNLPRVLRVQPLMGRAFTEAEQNSDAKVTVLSYWLWQRRFGGDSMILGRKILLNGETFEVIGVMPKDYQYPTAQFELWTPLFVPPRELNEVGLNYQYVAIGRLAHGVSVAQAQAEMSNIARQYADEHPQTNRLPRGGFVDVAVEPLLISNTLQLRTTMWVLLSAVGCLLLTGCLNLGTLMIARAGARAREMSVRAALGASSGRLRRQMLAEVIPLSAIGGAGGILLAWGLLEIFQPLLPDQMPRVESVGLNAPVTAFAMGISMLVMALAAILPSRIAARGDLAAALQHNSRSVAGGGRARAVLVVAQVAITIVLLIDGALFARSLAAVLRVNPGFSTQGILTMHLAVTRARHPQDSQVSDFYDRILERIRRVPGVVSAGIVNRLALSGIDQTFAVTFEGKPDLGAFDIDSRSSTPGYFQAAGIPIKQGRDFTAHDGAESLPVGIIDEQLARRVFGGEDPIGKRFRIPIPDQPWVQIIGVVGHILNQTLEKDVRPQVYWPESQRTQDRAALVIRASGPPELLASAVVAQIRSVDPDQPVYDVRTMNEWMSRTLSTRNLMTWLVGFFGGASVVLACMGLYGVVSYATGLRMREFGIRLALGATVGHVRTLVLGHAGKLVLGGCLAGIAIAFFGSKAIGSLLYGVSSWDGIAIGPATGLLITVALVASAGPARRATRTDPVAALRLE